MASPIPATPEQALAHFSKMIDSYEHRVGHACRAVASRLPAYLKSFPPRGKFLDNACGTGAMTTELLKAYPHARVSAVDVVPVMVDSFRAIIAASPLLIAQVEDLRLQDSQALTYDDESFDASVTNFGIFYFMDPIAGAREIYRTLKVGGTAVVTVWKAFGFKAILWEVQDRVKPIEPLVDLSLIDPWCDPAKLEGVLREGGFADVRFEIVTVGIWGRDKEDFKSVMVENFSAMVARNWNDGEKALLGPVTSEVLDELQERFCITDGDRVGCVMEAWVAVCTK